MSVTANIQLRKPNFTVENGYFYTFDEDQDALLQKTDDGTIAFSYPTDTLMSSTVISLEYDGVYFWALDQASKIIRWKIDNYVCKQQEVIDLGANLGSGHTVSSKCFTIEHYHTDVSVTISGGETTVFIGDYFNKPNIVNNAVLHFGPNLNGDEEDVVVTGTVFEGVTLAAPMEFNYDVGTRINFHRRLWLFNDYNGLDSSTGALYKFDSHTGGYMDKYPGGAYKAITASTFYKIESFTALGPTDMLLYPKGTNTLFVNVEEEVKDIYDAVTVNDTFTGVDTSLPDATRWSVENGTPTIVTNKLYLNLTTTGSESIKSKYFLDSDFDVYIEGNLGTYNSGYVEGNYYEHSLKLLFSNESDRYCKVSRGYSTEFGSNLFQNFSSISRLTTDTVVSGVEATVSGTNIDSYSLRMRRVGSEVHFYYQTIIAEVKSSWFSLGSSLMFDTEAQLIVSASSSEGSVFNTYSDNLTYTEGEVSYVSTALTLPYYGSMVMDNVESDEYTIDPLDDVAIDRNNMYRLHGGPPYSYNLSPLEPFVTSISLSASPAIIAANGLSTSDIKAWVKDQFLQPIIGRRVTFSENGDGSLVGGLQVNTDGSGYAQTIYQAGVSAMDVIITAVVQQTN